MLAEEDQTGMAALFDLHPATIAEFSEGLSVAAICLWGTLVGAMLPLMFKRLGIDPGYASSPFVATFVDVTGIVIYFTIASAYVL